MSLLLGWVLVHLMKFKITSMAGFKPFNQKSVLKQLIDFKDQKNGNNKVQSARISILMILDSSLIKIRNTGQTDAINVKIILDGIPLENYPGILIKDNYNIISAQESIVIQACVGLEIFPSEFIEVTWDDIEACEKIYRISLYH